MVEVRRKCLLLHLFCHVPVAVGFAGIVAAVVVVVVVVIWVVAF